MKEKRKKNERINSRKLHADDEKEEELANNEKKNEQGS